MEIGQTSKPIITKAQHILISEIFTLWNKLIEIYINNNTIEFSGSVLQYSNLYDSYSKIIRDSIENPIKNNKILQRFLMDVQSVFYSLIDINETHAKKAIVEGPHDDRRFVNPEWQQNLYFSTLKKFYYLITKYSLQWLNSISALDRKSRQQFHLYLKNMLNFIAPSNFLWTNPEIIKETFETGGENLLKGLKNYLEDLVLNNGRPNIRMTDTKAFQVGKNLAITPGKVIYQNDLMQLIQYLPTTTEVNEIPILFVPPWINKYYVLDLSPENSLVKWLVEQGFTVFMISWVNPGAELAHKEFSDYMNDGPIKALDIITSTTQCPAVHMTGYCIGGTLLSCALAILASRNDKRVASATFFMTLLDFTNPGELGIFINKTQLKLLDTLMKKKGYFDGRLLDITFNMLRPNDLIWPYFINNYLLGRPSKPFDLLFWNSDSSNLPYKMYSFYLKNMYLKNALRHPGEVKLNDIPINLNEIKIPTFFLGSETDHITLWRSVYKSALLLGGSKEFVLSGSGHVMGVINPPIKNKYYYKTNKKTDGKLSSHSKDWLNTSLKHTGSWWPYWKEWLMNINSSTIKSDIRDFSKSNTPILEDAPGSYVLKKIND